MTTLFDAIEQADAGTVWKLAKAGARLDEIEPTTELTPLALAALSGHAEIVRTLLEVGADPNVGGATTPLEAAVVEGHREVAEALIQGGVDVNRRVADGFTPLMTAAATGDLELARVLLAAGARTRLANDAGETAMAMAKAGGHSEVIEAIRAEVRRRREEAAASPPPEAESDRDEAATPAGENESRERPAEGEAGAETAATESAGAPDSESADADENESRAEASEKEKAEPEKTEKAEPEKAEPEKAGLEEPGKPKEERAEEEVESSRKSEKGAAADRGDGQAAAGEETSAEKAPRPVAEPIEVPAELLEQLGAGAVALATEVPAFAEPVLRLAQMVAKGDESEVETWLASGAIDVEARDADGRTPLMAAAYYGDPEPVRALLRAGADVDACDGTDSGHSALVYAARSLSPKRFEVISDLIAIGADVNRRCGRNQRTPLMYAVEADVYIEREGERGFALTTRHLLRHGAEIEAKDRRGNTIWRLIKRASLGAPTFSSYRRRLHQMLRALENMGAQPVASHRV